MNQEEKDQDSSDLEEIESEIDSLIDRMNQLNELPIGSKRLELTNLLKNCYSLVIVAQEELDEVEVDEEEDEEEEEEEDSSSSDDSKTSEET